MAEPRVIDGRDMEPPEPLERAMAALATLGAGEALVMLLRCEPVPLYAILDQNGYTHSSRHLPDGSNEITIRKA